MMNDNGSKFEFDRGLFGNFLELMFGHFRVRFVIDSLDLAPILGVANDPLKLNSRARSGVHSALWRIESRVCHQNFANRICHKVQVLATVSGPPCFKLLEKKILK